MRVRENERRCLNSGFGTSDHRRRDRAALRRPGAPSPSPPTERCMGVCARARASSPMNPASSEGEIPSPDGSPEEDRQVRAAVEVRSGRVSGTNARACTASLRERVRRRFGTFALPQRSSMLLPAAASQKSGLRSEPIWRRSVRGVECAVTGYQSVVWLMQSAGTGVLESRDQPEFPVLVFSWKVLM